MTSGATIAARLNPRDNALNLLRLVLAGLVIVSHASPLGGFGEDPRIGDLKLGTIAVGGFFAISGYLICQSRFHTSLVPFLWRRFLRIVPGLWACVLVVGFGFSAIMGVLRGGWTAAEGAGFAGSKALLLEAHYNIGATLQGLPMASSWNGPLWTIRYEIGCYVLAGLLGGFGLLRARPWITLTAFAASTVVSGLAVVLEVGIEGNAGKAAYLLPFFLAGAVLLLYRERVPLSAPWATAAAVALGVAFAFDAARVVAPLLVAYLLLWLAVALPHRARAVGFKNDLSYGVYLYGWPVQQLLVALGGAQIGLLGYTAACLVAVTPVAAASWFVVERPAMAWKGALDRPRSMASQPSAVRPAPTR